MNDEQYNQVSRFFITIAVIGILILVLAGCTSQEEKREYRQAQVSMVQTQVNAKTQQDIADATARQALYDAMAAVAAASPENADAIAVALAVSSVREEEGDNQPIVQLQREQNEIAEIAKSVAPALITTIGQVGVAAIQADVNKTQSDNAAAVAIADAATDADIMRSVTSMASTGLQNGGMDVGGNYYTAGGNMDQSVVTTNTSTATNTETNTETNTSTETTETNTVTDSYNQTDSNDTYTTNNTTSYQTPEGTFVSYEDLEALLAAGIRVTVVIDGEEVEVEQANCPDGSDGLTFGGGDAVCG
jgi:hypothetical protein